MLSRIHIFPLSSHETKAKRGLTCLSHLRKRRGGMEVLTRGCRIISTFREPCLGLRAIMLLLMISLAMWIEVCRTENHSCWLHITSAAWKPLTLWHKCRGPATSGWVSLRAIWKHTCWGRSYFQRHVWGGKSVVWVSDTHSSSCDLLFYSWHLAQCLEMIILIINFGWQMGLYSYNMWILVEDLKNSLQSNVDINSGDGISRYL